MKPIPPADTTEIDPTARIAALELRIARLEKINKVLIDRVERSVDNQGSAYSLFQTSIGLERQVRLRTDELTRTLRRLEALNLELIDARDRAERADRSKTRFLAQAGHDLLQPLNAARLAIAMLGDLEIGNDGRRLSRQVDRSLSNIENLLRTLLDISKLDAGVTTPRVTTVALGEVFADLAADFAPVAARRGLRFDVLATGVHVSTDPTMLTRILQNLIGNALRYTEKGRVLVGARRREASVRIDVIDTGPGIAEDQFAAIFEEFHRGRRQPGDTEIGLGLGLAIVQRLVDALGHDITLRSRLGRGSMFSVEMPRADGRPLPLAQPFADHPSQGWGLEGAFVVVIDNDADVRAATVELIERWHCEGVSAASGAQAAAAARAHGRRPDLLLVDYHLDEETAIEAVEAVRAAHGATIPAIVVTADYGRPTEERVAAAGLEMILKPVRPAELRALMAHLLG